MKGNEKMDRAELEAKLAGFSMTDEDWKVLAETIPYGEYLSVYGDYNLAMLKAIFGR